MPNKCCVYDCNGNYNKASKEFRLPSDPAERERWIKMIPRETTYPIIRIQLYVNDTFHQVMKLLLFLGERDLITHHLFSTV